MDIYQHSHVSRPMRAIISTSGFFVATFPGARLAKRITPGPTLPPAVAAGRVQLGEHGRRVTRAEGADSGAELPGTWTSGQHQP